MKTVEVKVYEFKELNEKAKEKAKQDHAALFGYAWQDEALASLKAMAEAFGAKLRDYEVDFFNSSHSGAKFDSPNFSRREIKKILDGLGSYDPKTLQGHGDCKLTGFCMDEDALDGFRRAFEGGESDLDTLLQAGFDSWLKSAQADCEGQYGDEQFAEHCEANEYWFTENGRRH